jgi:hypothetical protein
LAKVFVPQVVALREGLLGQALGTALLNLVIMQRQDHIAMNANEQKQ